MIKKTTFFSLLAGLLLTVACKDEPKATIVTTPEISFTKEADGYLVNKAGDTLQKLDLELADDDYQRETGLMYRQSMEQNQGMLFIFDKEEPRGFYMKNTHISLDIIFLNAQSKIINIHANAKPEDLSTILSTAPAQYVLEVNAGLAKEWKLEEGDQLIYKK